MALSDLTDSTVPFRARSEHHHHTWARTFHCRPEFYLEPESVEEVQKIVALAQRCRRRVTTVGVGHSPNELTLTSAWMVNLRRLNRVLSAEQNEDGSARVTTQAGISLHSLNNQRSGPGRGYIMPSIGSIDEQSIAGAIGTGTHGSSHRHGLLSQNVLSLRIVLASGQAVWCSPTDKADLFKAALCSLGALGIIVEVEYRMIPERNIRYETSLMALPDFLAAYNRGIWQRAEYVRCWWMPYMQRMIVWQGDSTTDPERGESGFPWATVFAGHYLYKTLLWISNFVPRILPTVEWYIFGLQNRFSPGPISSGVGKQQDVLLMDCLFSQWVNEWALPLEKGPEAIDRLSKWLNGDETNSRIPFSSKNLWVHCPIEVRISDTSAADPRPFLDPSYHEGPSLYLNATLYRAYDADPPCRRRYYEAFEWLMKDLGARPHWAKNYEHVSVEDVQQMYGDNLNKWLKVRNEVDPLGLFVGPWHRRKLLGEQVPPFPLEEQETGRENARAGGTWVYGAQKASQVGTPVKRDSYKSEDGFEALSASMSSADIISLASETDNGH